MLSEGHATLSVALLFGELPGAELRRTLDEDGDGRVSAQEIARHEAHLRAEAGAWLALTVDGRPARVDGAEATVQLGGDDRASAAPAVVQLMTTTPLGPGPHTFTVQPGKEPPRLGETEVVLDATGVWRLVETRRAGGTAELETRFKFQGSRAAAAEERSVTFVVRPEPGRVEQTGASPALYGGLSLALIACGVALAIYARRVRAGG